MKNKRSSQFLTSFVTSLILFSLVISPAQAAGPASRTTTVSVSSWQQVNKSGFGDLNNNAVNRMSVFNGYLYAGTANNNGGQVWRATNGADWNQVNQAGFGNASNTVAELGESFNGYLYVGTANSATGGEIWRCAVCNGSDWKQVASAGFGDSNNTVVERVVVFSGSLYATTDSGTGVQVWKSASGDAGTWTQANTAGFGNPQNTGLWAAAVFNAELYVATAQWGVPWDSNNYTGTEVWRSSDGSNWSKVNTDGFGDRANMSPWLETLNGYLYALSLNFGTGAQIWRCATCDGSDWTRVVADGFGDLNNIGGSFMVSDGGYLYAGTNNSVIGTEIWKTKDGTSWSQVNVAGFGDGNNTDTRSGAFFNGDLYLGTLNAAHGGEIWASNFSYTAPAVVSSLRAGPSPTNAASVDFTVSFSEAVSGVDTTDFALATTGLTGAFVSGVNGWGASYTVTVNTGSGDGTIRLDLPASATITDLAGDPLAALPYSGGETYTISSTAHTTVDASTMEHKLLMGYQGWFTCQGDGSNTGYLHWFRDNNTDAAAFRVDMFPDASELTVPERCPTDMVYPNGQPAYLYSAYNRTTVMRHFKWMSQYGVDGVFVQRFGTEVTDRTNPHFNARNVVTQNARAGAEAYGRVFSVMYDTSGMDSSTFVNVLEQDWIYMVDVLHVTASPSYLHQNGKPVLAIWGLGFTEHPGTPAQAMELLNFFEHNSDARYQVTLVGGVPTWWRILANDSQTDPAWANYYCALNVISPWTVGRYTSDTDVDWYKTNGMIPDMAAAAQCGAEYMPVVFPGTAFHNSNPGVNRFNDTPRRGGNFYWRQVYNAVSIGAPIIYNAMFDEVDEDTAMYKIAATRNDEPVGVCLVSMDTDGYSLPNDWYLLLAGAAQRMLRGENPMASTIPIGSGSTVPSTSDGTCVDPVPGTRTFKSAAAQDGWVLESSENSNKGGTLNNLATTLNLGDNAARRQYRAILSFNTGDSLPDTAVITTAILKVKKSLILGGGNPVTMFRGFMLDIKNGLFGKAGLQPADFQAPPSATYGPFLPAPVNGWYSIKLVGADASINKLGSGLTQIRLRFKLDDNNNAAANILSLFSGNATAANRPQLIITYYVP